MDLIIDAFLVEKNDVQSSRIRVNENNHELIIEKFNHECNKIVDIFKEMKKDGLIKSIYRPKNKLHKHQIRRLIEAKRSMRDGIDKIKQIYK